MDIPLTQFSLLILVVALCAPATFFIIKRREANLIRLNNELIEARRQLERTNQDLERLDETKSDFISIASHELRTPLTVIKGYAEMLLEDPYLDPNIRVVMRGIHEGAIRLHEVMDSMFDIAQIDARSLRPNFQTIELGLLLREACSEQAKTVSERKQSLAGDLPVLPCIRADANLLRKLFHHLLVNAIKFTPNGGAIAITGASLPEASGLPEGAVEIIISDTGVGVHPNFHEIIFSKFFQPGELGKHSSSRTRFKGGGAGLGLALAKGIVEAHGGRIYVESPGYDEFNLPGSRFHILLPFNKPQAGGDQKMSEALKFEM
jgi:signal transduction histidine kinase